MFNNITFILNKPQLSENIGACARAMKNFNFSKLVLINPKPSFPNDKIIALSVGAKEIIKKSKKVKSASKKEIISMINLCIKNLEDIEFFKPKEKKPIMLENLRNIFYRMELSSKETRILSSVFASLGKKR